MTPDEEKRLLREVHENNIMLYSIIRYLNMQSCTKEQKDFFMNIAANIIGNKINLGF